jgi:hypothetical protein
MHRNALCYVPLLASYELFTLQNIFAYQHACNAQIEWQSRQGLKEVENMLRTFVRPIGCI